MLESLFIKSAGFQAYKALRLIKRRLQHMCFPMNIAKCLRTVFFKEQLRWLFLSVWYSNCSVFGIYRPSLLNQKYDRGWFLIKLFVDLVRIRFSHIINVNCSNMNLLINLQETKVSRK